MKWPLLIRLVVLALLIAFLVTPESFAFLLQPLTKNGQPAIYDRGSLWS
ncbi:MAG: ABC transporter permease, partial [Devosia nanyangense]|nr:ABC transporter permease [Devosia nanyangense]